MKNAYFILYQDGGMAVEILNSDKYGDLTKADKEHLTNRGYTSWANLTALSRCGERSELTEMAQALGLLPRKTTK